MKALLFGRGILLFLHPRHTELPQCAVCVHEQCDSRHPCCGAAGEGAGLCLFCILPLGSIPQAAGGATQSLGFLWVIPVLISHTNPGC